MMPPPHLSVDRRLVLRQSTWERGLRTLLERQRGWLVGELTTQGQQHGVEHLVFDLEWRETAPDGESLPPLAAWLIVGTQSGAQRSLSESARHLEAVQRRRSLQTLVVVLLDSERPGRWTGLVHAPSGTLPLDEVRLVGAEMLTLSSAATEPEEAADFNSVDQGRWSRTAGALGQRVVSRLRSSTVTLIGAGRNGSLLAVELAALGVGHLRIADADVLKVENLDAMPHADVGDVGQTKLAALAGRLRGFRPDLNLTLLTRRAGAPQTARWLRQRTDLLATSVDNDTARLAVATIAARTATVHLDLGTLVEAHGPPTQRIAGDVRLLLPGEGCVSCVGGIVDFESSLHELTSSPGSLPRRLRAGWNDEGRGGSLISINSITVGAAVQLWLDLLAGHLTTSYWQRIVWDLGAGLRVDSGPVGASPTCRVCRREALWG